MNAPHPAKSPAPGPIRRHLRQSTHAAHIALNHHPVLSGIIHAGYPIARYQALLAAYLPLYIGLEKAIEQFISQHPSTFDYAPRRKRDLLASDLQFFGYSATPLTLPVPPIESQAELIGVLYVIEGSTLGGDFIARLITQNMSIDAGRGGEFFNVYGAKTEERWQEFCTFIESCEHDTTFSETAAQRAISTFELFRQVLDRAANQLGLCYTSEAG